MSKIIISDQILDGNLGDDWKDNAAAAHALAAYLERQWVEDLEGYTKAGHEVVIDIEVLENTSGACRPLSVLVADDSEDSPSELDIERELTDEGSLWEDFCCSEEAADL
jgi:hypothetical protein